MISPGNQTSEWRLIVGFLAIVSAALFIYVGFIFLGYANGDLTWFDAMEQIRGLADLLDWETAAPVMVYILSRLGVKWKAAPSPAPAITAHDVAEEVLARLKKEDA